ncbi:predicted protein [Chaetomium globosum CBS 148.51]|uniref:Uncharacterized protein n=1 Tax=Chaetomium globosum (strain ATCC 6205 / CBS 148.51 / DSM 1962 / NBRC 6347 / NRRL 1970) TaxID=306901 RepID=Q2H060_CHAGB|nr:uncharacterized protein CHGG_04836 [Chaetomium globosum CBS 148.51]EAQ88217.1 predicted protein [Chaetomium globosum CBS 148.51]
MVRQGPYFQYQETGGLTPRLCCATGDALPSEAYKREEDKSSSSRSAGGNSNRGSWKEWVETSVRHDYPGIFPGKANNLSSSERAKKREAHPRSEAQNGRAEVLECNAESNRGDFSRWAPCGSKLTSPRAESKRAPRCRAAETAERHQNDDAVAYHSKNRERNP